MNEPSVFNGPEVSMPKDARNRKVKGLSVVYYVHLLRLCALSFCFGNEYFSAINGCFRCRA